MTNESQPAGGVKNELLEAIIFGCRDVSPNWSFGIGAQDALSIATELLAYRRRPPADAGKADTHIMCQRCQGTGEIVTDWDRYLGVIPAGKNAEDDYVTPCPSCDGTGYCEAPADAGKADSGEVLGTIRICPERDGPCPYGMKCPWTINQYYCRQPPVEAPTPPVPVSEDAVEAAQALYEFVAALGVHGPAPAPWQSRSAEHKQKWRDALAAALPHMARGDQGAGAVRVKPLEWTKIEDANDDQSEEAATPFGGYVITADPFTYSTTTAYYVDGPDWFKTQCASAPEAKAAAQADYARRINSALITPSTEQVTALVDGAAQFLWGLLDDIDTLDDACRADDAMFRARVRKVQRRRFDVGSTDGYTVSFAKAPAPDDTKGGA